MLLFGKPCIIESGGRGLAISCDCQMNNIGVAYMRVDGSVPLAGSVGLVCRMYSISVSVVESPFFNS